MHEFLPRHHDVGGALAIGTLELQHDLAFAIAAYPLVGNRRAGDLRAQSFEPLSARR
jgi:hypothetical protein